MATPDYLQQAIVSRRKYGASGRRTSMADTGLFRRPSITSSVWASVDMLTVVVAAVVALRFRVVTPPEVSTLHVLPHLIHSSPDLLFFYIGWFGVCVVFFTRSYGLYGPIQHRSGLHEQRMTVQATLTSGLLLCGTLYLSSAEAISRVVVALMVVFTMALLCLRRALWRRMVYQRFRAGVETRNVLIVGAGRVGHALRNHIDTLQHLGFRFKGFVALSEREVESGDGDVIGDVRNCLSLARSLFVDEIFFSVPAEKKLVIDMVEEARVAGIDVRVVPDMYDGLAWNARVEYIGQFPTIPLHRKDFPIGGILVKRVLDITVSSIALVAGLPAMLAIAIAIRIDSVGSTLYKAQRIGRKGRAFPCYKFRTMVSNADSLKLSLRRQNQRSGPTFKISGDPRITKLGHILRRYSLDELPQLWNVLKGEMSLVGPRPHPLDDFAGYEIEHLARLDVMPGMTGLWQVTARRDPSFQAGMKLDIEYIRRWSLGMDLRILLKTAAVVLRGSGE